MSQELKVMVDLVKADGSHERVCIGTAIREGGGLALSLEGVFVGEGACTTAWTSAPSLTKPSPSRTDVDELEYYAQRARKALADPRKAKWHDHERAVLLGIEKELARRGKPSPPG
jgi:hypothetical protein